MSVTLDFKDVIDIPRWRSRAPLITAASAGVSLAYDMTGTNDDRTKNIYALRANASLDLFDSTTNEWVALGSPALTGTFGAGATCIFAASAGPRSKILSGATTSSFQVDGLFNNVPATPGVSAAWTRVTTTATVTWTSHPFAVGQQLAVTASSDVAAIPLGLVTVATVAANTFTFTCLNAGAASGTLTIGIGVAPNQLANRGDGLGYTIRVIDNGSGGTGKVEERKIVANTGGTQPTVYLSSALSFTPVAGSSFEIRSGRVFMITSGAPTAGMFKYYDPATNTYSGNLATTNLPTIATDTSMVALSEDYVPHNRVAGSGFVNGGATYNGSRNCIQATAAGATSITGSGMPSAMVDNEYRNFQIRIVDDAINTTAVGQRSRIASHTGGANGVFTVAAWAVTPSASAKFVVENDDDKILLFTASTSVATYNIASNAWNTTTFTAAPVASGAGVVAEQAFGIVTDAGRSARNSMIYRIRGGGSAAIDVLDIAGGANGVWETDILYNKRGQTFTTGTAGAYDPITFSGRLLHLNVNGTQRFVRFDMLNRVLDAGTYVPFPPSTAVAGAKLAIAYNLDGPGKIGELIYVSSNQVQMFGCLIQR